MAAAGPGEAADGCDVLVIGYGPVGQTLTIMLAERGYRVSVVERWADATVLIRCLGAHRHDPATGPAARRQRPVHWPRRGVHRGRFHQSRAVQYGPGSWAPGCALWHGQFLSPGVARIGALP
jgi:hypothetical protein